MWSIALTICSRSPAPQERFIGDVCGAVFQRGLAHVPEALRQDNPADVPAILGAWIAGGWGVRWGGWEEGGGGAVGNLRHKVGLFSTPATH